MRLPRSLLPVLLLFAGLPLAPASAAPSPPQKVRIEAAPGGSLLVHGEYPPVRSSCVDPVQPVLHARYRGVVEVGRESNGSLYLIGELPFEEYLKGIAEVPRSWPMEALKAQVIAARSYATVQLSRSSSDEEALGYDLCATDACQVYLGMGVEAGPWGSRWVRAVERTAGQVLLYQGEPAETLYFSTSSGRTYGNDRVFGSSPLPYLRGIRERDDGESPVSHWTVRIPFDDLARLLRAAGRWQGGAIRRARDDGRHIVLRGAGPEERTVLHRDDLRSALNATARCLMPDRYPTTEADGYRLPQPVPSIWYEAEQDGRALVLKGRGWGHGVGMVQWGAKGKADRGLGAGDILAAYYGGLRPRRVSPPGTIRVLIARGLRSLTIAPEGEAGVRIPRRDGAPRPPWRITAGKGIRVRHGGEPPALLEVEGFAASRRGRPREPVRATFTASAGVRARLEFLQDGRVVETTDWKPFREEAVVLRERLPEEPGRYRVRAAASDGVDTVTTRAVPIRVRGAPVPAPSPALPRAGPSPTAAAAPVDRGNSFPWVPWALVLLAAMAVGAFALVLTFRHQRGLHRR